MEPLHVVTAVFNPERYHSRYRLYEQFKARIESNPNVVLHTVEASFGDRPHVITDPSKPNNIQVQTTHEFFLKENLINLGIIRSVPQNAKYIASIDADVSFARLDWAEETVHQLQHFDVVQMFSHAYDLGPNHQIIQKHVGFGHAYQQGVPHSNFDFSELISFDKYSTKPAFWHPGFAWAYRRTALDTTSNLLDWAIVGAGDHLMALAYIGHIEKGYHGGVTEGFKKAGSDWQKKALKLKGNIGSVDGTLLHYWHGKKKNRQYKERWSISIDHEFDPYIDISKDSYGLITLSDEKPKLKYDIRNYLRARNEDSIDE